MSEDPILVWELTERRGVFIGLQWGHVANIIKGV